MKNFRKSKKALSPVVASIILIAVTVAVSIAVAAWMGALTIGFMATEELKITSVNFNVPLEDIVIKASNTGTTSVTISEVWVSGVNLSGNWTSVPSTNTVAANGEIIVTISTYTGLSYGDNYQVKLVTSKGNAFMYTASAPS